jgi:DNA polymerase I-like protein with 3'-5' exonuclease and polymerase domains
MRTKEIDMSEYLILDLETTIKKSFKRTANPLDPDNRIIAIGTKLKDRKAHGEYVDWRLGDGPGVQDFETTKDIIVGHNIKFDLLYLWKYKGVQDFIQRGGKIWDTQLAEYYLTGQQTRWYDCSLRDLAVRKYGCPERTKYMEEYWNKDICTSKIPKEIVLEDVKNDVMDTEQIYATQLTKAQELGMLPLLETVMNELLVTTEIEYNGMYIDRQVLENNKLELELQLIDIEQEFNELVRKYWK